MFYIVWKKKRRKYIFREWTYLENFFGVRYFVGNKKLCKFVVVVLESRVLYRCMVVCGFALHGMYTMSDAQLNRKQKFEKLYESCSLFKLKVRVVPFGDSKL